jgi:hypothetical protein
LLRVSKLRQFGWNLLNSSLVPHLMDRRIIKHSIKKFLGGYHLQPNVHKEASFNGRV